MSTKNGNQNGGQNGHHESENQNGHSNGHQTNGNQPTRTLITIGGHEDKKGEKVVLREVARRVGKGKLVVTTVASHKPEGYFEDYEPVFRELGVEEVVLLEIHERKDASEAKNLDILDGASGVFFTGGDQLKITSQIGDTPVFRRIQEIYQQGGVIAGTSAGASVVCETMLVSGSSDESHKVGDTLRMAPGLGLIQQVIIDQHFAERGRMGRLLGAVSQNPRILGIGIDEGTALVIENETKVRVLGEGAVYVVDATGVTHSNIAEKGVSGEALSIYDIKLHVLSHDDQFDIPTRRPGALSGQVAAKIQLREAEVVETGSAKTEAAVTTPQ
jgi:cyanophycinase